MENNPVMKEFWAGFADFIRTFWRNAAKQGFSIMLLIVTNVGFILWVDRLNTDILKSRAEHRIEIQEVRIECRADIAQLRMVIDSLKNGLDDCTATKLRLEGQNAVLLEMVKKLKR